MKAFCASCGLSLSDSTTTRCPKCGSNERSLIVVQDESVAITEQVSDVFYPKLSLAWLRDLASEPETTSVQSVRDIRRRQIVTAATFADSYLYEWVRDEVLIGRPDRWTKLFEVFPDDDRRGVVDRWKEVPSLLAQEGLMAGRLDLATPVWSEFRRLVTYRDGLVHGKASRPDGTQFPDEWTPVPTMRQIEELGDAWAVGVVRDLLQLLHESAGTAVPQWVLAPERGL